MGNQLRLLLLLSVTILSISSQAQKKEDEAAIKLTINRLFMGMEKGDSTMVHSAFANHVTMATIGMDQSSQSKIIFESSIADFLKAVGTPHTEVWYEEIWDVMIRVDGNFAQAWCDYAFYIGNIFSHCGVDAFHFYKDQGGWKIFHLADTRRKDNCIIPTEIQIKHKK